MKNKLQLVALIVVVLGVVSLVVGAVFVGIAIQKNNYIVSQLKAQGITLNLTQAQINQGQVIDNAAGALAAANTLAEHLKSISPSYNALMAANTGGRYDPTDPNDLNYTQGLNLENSLDLVVLSFGVVQATEGTGAVMIVIGLSIIGTGLVLFKLCRSSSTINKA